MNVRRLSLSENATALLARAEELATRNGQASVTEEHVLLVVSRDLVGGILLLSQHRLCVTRLTSALDARLARTQPIGGYRGAIPEKRQLDAVLERAASNRSVWRRLRPLASRDVIAAVLASSELRSEIDSARFDVEEVLGFARRAAEEAARRRHRILAEHALLGACDAAFFREPLSRAGIDVGALKRALSLVLRNRALVSAKLASPEVLVTSACVRANFARAGVVTPVALVVDLLRNSYVRHTLDKRGFDPWTLMFALCHGVSPDAEEPIEGPRAEIFVHDDPFTSMEHVVEVLSSVFELTKADAGSKMRDVHELGSAVIGTFGLADARARAEKAREASRAAGMPLRIVLSVARDAA